MTVSGLTGTLPAIRAHYADILCQLVEEMGGTRQAVLAGAGLRASQLGHPDNFITVNQFTALCRAALIESDEPALGLEYGRRLKFTTHGSLSQAAISCDTIEHALNVLIKYFRLRFAYMDLQFFVEDDSAVLQLDISHDVADLYQFNVEVVMASLMDVNLLLFGPRLLEGGRCRVDYPQPGHIEAYRSLFGHGISFEQGVNQLRFRREFLGLPISLSNPVARRLAEAQCEEELRMLEDSATASTRVVRLMASVKGGRLPGLEEVAERLNVSSRTLRRQLSAEGVGFQGILDDVRHQRALELLQRSRLSIDEIAYRLGYSDPSNFGRAFRKWEGMSPTAWRSGRGQDSR